MTETSQSLRFLADYFQYWRDWNRKERDKENLTTDKHTAIMCVPPHWPSHGTIGNWVETLRRAAEELEAK